jgi:hypothetical protein
VPRLQANPLALPRSVVLAMWLPYLTAAESTGSTRAVAAVTGDDEPHLAELGPERTDLPALVSRWMPVDTCGAALPVPGAPGGSPAEVAGDALAAGECLVVASGADAWAAVPVVTRFGSEVEPGNAVTWRVRAVPGADRTYLAAVASLAEARAALHEALRTATDALVRLDIAQRRPEAAHRIADLASARIPDWPLPAEVPHERLELLARAARLLAVVDLAVEREDPTATRHASDRRIGALRQVVTAARGAMSAATTFVDAGGRGYPRS